MFVAENTILVTKIYINIFFDLFFGYIVIFLSFLCCYGNL